MIPVVTNSTITELKSTAARIEITDKALKREIEERNAKGNQPSADDNASLVAMVLADPDNIALADDDAAKNKIAWQKRAAIDTARQVLKTKLANATYAAGTDILNSPGVQKQHADLMKRISPPLAEIAKAYVELFGMSRELIDRGIGFRCGICETMPLDLFGAPNALSPLADYLNQCVKAGYISAGAVPKEMR